MKKFKVVFLVAVVVVLSAVTVWAAVYDSAEDPLVTLSYLTNIFQPRTERMISDTESALRQEIDALKAALDAGGTPSTGIADGYEVLYVLKDEMIIAQTQCEIILRAGTAEIVSPFEDQGVADLTAGKDLLAKTNIEKNHFLLVPRGGDGRGVMVTSESAYIMVRGIYTIVKP